MEVSCQAHTSDYISVALLCIPGYAKLFIHFQLLRVPKPTLYNPIPPIPPISPGFTDLSEDVVLAAVEALGALLLSIANRLVGSVCC